MKTNLLRQLWHIIDETPTQILLNLDVNLVEQMLARLETTIPLSPEEHSFIRNYIQSKTPLIRELAYDRS